MRCARAASNNERQSIVATKWLEIFRNADDNHVGQTIVRLAALAEAAHQHHHALAGAIDHTSTVSELRVEGLDPKAVDAPDQRFRAMGPMESTP